MKPWNPYDLWKRLISLDTDEIHTIHAWIRKGNGAEWAKATKWMLRNFKLTQTMSKLCNNWPEPKLTIPTYKPQIQISSKSAQKPNCSKCWHLDKLKTCHDEECAVGMIMPSRVHTEKRRGPSPKKKLLYLKVRAVKFKTQYNNVPPSKRSEKRQAPAHHDNKQTINQHL